MQLIVKIVGCQLVDFQECRPLICLRPFFSGVFYLRQMHPGPVCQHLQCFWKRIIFILHNKSDRIASCTAAKTVIHLLLRRHGKRRGFFIMERTKSEIVCPFLLKLYISRDHIYNVIPCPYFFYDIFRIIHEILLSICLALMHFP